MEGEMTMKHLQKISYELESVCITGAIIVRPLVIPKTVRVTCGVANDAAAASAAGQIVWQALRLRGARADCRQAPRTK